MFFFVRKRKLLEMKEQFQQLCKSVEDCQVQIARIQEAMQKNQQDVLFHMDAAVVEVSQKLDGVQNTFMRQNDAARDAQTAKLKEALRINQRDALLRLDTAVGEVSQKLDDVQDTFMRQNDAAHSKSVETVSQTIEQLQKDLSAQLALLDNSARLLLLQNVMNEIEQGDE